VVPQVIVSIVDQDTEHNAAKKLMRITERGRTLPLHKLHQLEVACPGSPSRRW